MLAKCYIEVLGLDRHSEAAQRLIKWKQPVDGQTDISGDFARVCYHEIAARSTVEAGSLTVDAVNSLLDELSKGRLKQYVVFAGWRRAHALEPNTSPFFAVSTRGALQQSRSGSFV
jgi:hypothetical protein